NGQYARHNTAYWQGKHYLGIGPSAHSFNGRSRSWNIANNARYIAGINTGSPLSETEALSLSDRFNEYIMTSLRTMWGVDTQSVEREFGSEVKQELLKNIQPFMERREVLWRTEHSLALSPKGKLMADYIASELFWLTE